MAKEKLGFVRLEWQCPNCARRNPGPFKFCQGCGAPQPAEVKFTQAEVQELLTDEKEIAAAAKGPDKFCGYCGARNANDAKVCASCGADLSVAKAMEAGSVVGAFTKDAAEMRPCPTCGAPNPVTGLNCTQCGAPLERKKDVPEAKKAGCAPWMIAVAVGAFALFIFLIMMMTRTEEVTGTVEGVAWQRQLAVEALGPVQKQDWYDNLPAGVTPDNCSQKYFGTSESPSDNSNKVCGTPYSVDQGNGFAEVVQDCYYEIYKDYCTYTVQDWKIVNTLKEQGSDLYPRWPSPLLSSGQREGTRSESYSCFFNTDSGQMVYETRDVNDFSQCMIGSRWILNVSTMGSVVSIAPAP